MDHELITHDELQYWLRDFRTLMDTDLIRIKHSIQRQEQVLYHLSIDLDAYTNSVSGCFTFFKSHKKRSRKLKRVKQEQATGMSSKKQLQSLLAPIRRLPPELLSEIFLHCVQPCDQFVKPSPKEAPMLLGQICASWRTLALSTPRLWSSLELCRTWSSFNGKSSVHDAAALMKLWLERSGQRPLSISIRDDLLEDPTVRELFIRVTPRWQHILIDVPRSVTSPLFSPHEHASQLESVTVRSSKGLEPAQVENMSLTLLAAQRLQYFNWDNSELESTPINMAWSALTHVTLNAAISVEQCMYILQDSPNLVDASFQCISAPSESMCPLMPSIVLPKLKSLVLGGGYDISPILDFITLPNLLELVLNVREWPQDALCRFFRRSRCPLMSFNLYFPSFTESDFIECLELLSASLKEFTVQMDPLGPSILTDDVLDRLTYKEEEEKNCLCPALDVIAAYDCISCTDNRFSKMVESRVRAPVTLNDNGTFVSPVKVIELYEKERELVKELKELRREGLILKIYSEVDGQPIDMDPEDVRQLQALRDSGLILRVYDPTSGLFGQVMD
ncbi:hypothetical protein BDQ12DRAFT_680803 [Crucibulum laeve]|uniref:Uncharacterized protein n=1 Tax=Crucibulum laeve TaxID=68775 RepID=A0A5C3M4N1_9AGAR|nr:hypothetical protein BDQ12DRAFT_680803 [Crucibulum laeve]